jgi:hypothetical protein
LPVTLPLSGSAGRADTYVNPTDGRLRAWSANEPLALGLAPNRTGLAVWGRHGELLALERADEAHCAAYSLDRQDLRQSKQLCILPLTEGELRLPTEADWRQPIAVVGEVIDGRWIEYDRLDLERRGSSLRIPIDQDRCLSILLVAEPGSVGSCAKALVRSLTEPWRLR